MMKISSNIEEKYHSQNDLASKLEKIKTSNNLLLSEMVLDDISCIDIAHFILQNDILMKLEITDGNITSKGLANLSEAILNSSSLKTLCFSRNKISDLEDSNFGIFCNALSRNKHIKELDLSYNSIGFDCCRHIGNLIRNNFNIETINLKHNSIGNEASFILLDALSLNPNLKFLELEGNAISEDTLLKINTILNQNQAKHEKSSRPFPIQGIPREEYLPLLSFEAERSQYFELDTKYKKLVVDYKTLQEETFVFKKNYERDKRSLDLYKSGFTQTIDQERGLRLKREDEIRELKLIIDSNEMKFQQMMNEQKSHFENIQVKIEGDLNIQVNENIKLHEFNVALEKSIEELKIKNECLCKDQFVKEEEFKQKLDLVIKESFDSKEEMARHVEFHKNKLIQNDIDNAKLNGVILDLENKHTLLINDFESKMLVERKVNTDLNLIIKDLNDKIAGLEQVICNIEKEIFNRDQQLMDMKSKADIEILNLKDDIMKVQAAGNQKIAELKLEISHLEEQMIKLRLDCNEENARIQNEDQAKMLHADEIFNMRYNELLTKYDDIQRIRFMHEDEIVKLNAILTNERLKYEEQLKFQHVSLSQQFNHEKEVIIKDFDLKLNEISLSREEVIARSQDLLKVIDDLKSKQVANQASSAVEFNSLQTENITLRHALDECQIQISTLQKEIGNKSFALKKYTKHINSLCIENQQMGLDLTIASHSLNDYEQLQASYNELEFQYNNEKNKAIFFEEEFTKAKAYAETLLDEINRFQIESRIPISSSPIVEDQAYPYAIRPVTKFIRKTVKIPKGEIHSISRAGFKH